MRFLRENRWAVGLLCLGGAFLAVGICRGEAEAVMMKAIRICMECIGLG